MNLNTLSLCLLTGFALVLSGCEDGDSALNPSETAEKIEPGDVEDEEVALGTQVTLKGEVTEVYDTHSFSLSDVGFDFEKDLVVVTKDPLPFNAEDDAIVQVKGKVAEYSVVEVEKEYGWDLDPQVEVELEDTEYYLSGATVTVLEPDDD